MSLDLLKLRKIDSDEVGWDQSGDHLYMEDYLLSFKPKEMCDPTDVNVIFLSYANPNPVAVFNKMGGDLASFEMYECPYLKREFMWTIPYALLVKTESKITDIWREVGLNRWWLDMSLDQGWNKSKYRSEFDARPDLNSIETCLLGSGNTFGTCVDDGSVAHTWAIIRIGEGDDLLLCKSNLWFNK